MSVRDKTRLKIWLAVLAVFVTGGVTGASLASAYHLGAGSQSAGRGGENLFRQLRGELNLSDTQAVQIRAIIEETGEKYRALRAECRPRYDAARAGARERIRALLTPDQQAAFDAIVRERDSAREERDDR
jgi:Spy/CpxP family protein refolding chaperone